MACSNTTLTLIAALLVSEYGREFKLISTSHFTWKPPRANAVRGPIPNVQEYQVHSSKQAFTIDSHPSCSSIYLERL